MVGGSPSPMPPSNSSLDMPSSKILLRGKISEKCQNNWCLRGQKNCGAYGAAKKALCTLIFSFYCRFKKQFFEKITKISSKPNIAKILLFIAFLKNSFFQISQNFSKTAPSAPNFGSFAPKILPSNPRIDGGTDLLVSGN